ncbi:MAG: hypothetical protein JW719_13710, partial [Pirellulales bacterium]|nr:hypothetical protein [Pirellulales bacterium]
MNDGDDPPSIVYPPRPTAHGPRPTAHGPRPTAHGLRPTAYGLLLAACCLFLPATVQAEPWYEDFEGPTPSWRQSGGDVQLTVARHQRTANDAHTGRQSEWFQIVGHGGTSAYVSHDVGRPRVIPELSASVWVKSDRPGIQIFARVVLPRTQDPRSQTPVHVRLEGASYSQVGRWQQLRIQNLPEMLARRIRGLRLQMGPQVDGREAYVDQIVLNLYGGPGTTNVWIDELNLVGFADLTPTTRRPAVVPLSSLPDARPSTGPAAPSNANATGGDFHSGQVAPINDSLRNDANSPSRPESASGGASTRQRRAKLVGFELQVDGQPTLLRAVTYQGESLTRLKELGLNAIWLSRPASPSLLAEADRVGMMVVCRPPESVLAASANDPAAPLPTIGPEYDPVIAWDLGSELSRQQVTPTRELA